VNLASPVNATVGDAVRAGHDRGRRPGPDRDRRGLRGPGGERRERALRRRRAPVEPEQPERRRRLDDESRHATPGTDYLAAAGVLTFFAGDTARTASASVLGDTAVEADESFTLAITNATNATVGTGQAPFVILDDDAPSLAREELAHGSSRWADLAAAGGVADEDFYRIAQQPRASYEIVVDGASGDVAPDVRLERLAADNATVLQSATPVGTGTSVSPALGERAGERRRPARTCACAARPADRCGLDDVYRIRAYDTTYSIPRFNNSATQGTVVVLQNRSSRAVAGHLNFWDASGALLLAQPFALGAPRTLARTRPSCRRSLGRSGSITCRATAGTATSPARRSPWSPRPASASTRPSSRGRASRRQWPMLAATISASRSASRGRRSRRPRSRSTRAPSPSPSGARSRSAAP
jgi:hypothetical protein